ncbi:MAG: 3-oxoacyl-[acyl-carrier-protein] reductase [bacterium]
MKLEGKVALITGASQGIGRNIALFLAENGANIIGLDVDEKGLEKLSIEIKEKGQDVLVLKVDVSNLIEVEQAKNEILKKFSNINILVNNAGITRDNLLIRMSQEEWQKVIDINLTGPFNLTKIIGKEMIKQKSGVIINISSVIGIMGNLGQANYAASKAGLIGLTKTTAKEFSRRGIRVNAIAPGFIETKMTDKLSMEAKENLFNQIPLQRLGQPQDIANLVLFLSSDDSSYITGQVIQVDGGLVM